MAHESPEPISVVIRALNEAGPLRRLLDGITAQDYKGAVELVVVDNESGDDTAEIARAAGAKVVTIKRDEFSYPRSMNLGVAAASSELVVLTVAHAWPVSPSWLSSGAAHFRLPSVAGVYSPVLARPDATPEEQAFYLRGYTAAKKAGPRPVQPGEMGVFGATNCMFRRSLWQKHPFDERYGAGGEDGEWAAWAVAQGYTIVCDADFAVYHSHGHKNEDSLAKQIEYWSNLSAPMPFDRKKLKNHRSDPFFD